MSMKGTRIAILTTTLVLALAAWAGAAQAAANFSGTWTLNQELSGPETRGISPQVSFPTDLTIKQTPSEFNLQTSTTRQDTHTFLYKFDGSEASVKFADGTVVTGKAVWDGPKLVITSKRVFSSELLGDFVADYVEAYTVSGNLLTVERVQSVGGVTLKGKAVYTKAS